jgi:ubiquinone/menaquinone biosynthesis C-methylase UbiE
MSKSKKMIPARVPEGEAMEGQEELTIEEINSQFKKRMWEHRNFVKFILKELKLKDNSKVLEIGPGPAWISIILVQENPSITLTGLEISEDMIRLANQNVIDEKVNNNIEFIQGNAQDMSMFEDNSFDAVITHDSLHHWKEPILIFNEIARVLKPNGILCIEDGRRDLGIGAKITFNIIKQFIPKMMGYYWKTSIMAGYTESEVREILDQTELSGKFEIKTDLFDIKIYNKQK